MQSPTKTHLPLSRSTRIIDCSKVAHDVLGRDRLSRSALAADDDGLIALILRHAAVGVFGDGEEMRLELAFPSTGIHLHVGRRVERDLCVLLRS